jgi:hypothetical protein
MEKNLAKYNYCIRDNSNKVSIDTIIDCNQNDSEWFRIQPLTFELGNKCY